MGLYSARSIVMAECRQVGCPLTTLRGWLRNLQKGPVSTLPTTPVILSVRTCHKCGDCGRVREEHHEPNGTSLGADGSAVHSGWKSIPGE